MQLRQFEARLAALIGRPSTSRPFVCDGSPLDCDVFIVGANAATSLSHDFWDFWRPGLGMDKAAWFEAYKAERVSQPLPPGKTRRAATSNTRRNVDHVVDGAWPVRCLETNVYSIGSSTTRQLKPNERTTAVVEFPLEAVAPRLILAHGVDAANELRRLHTSGPKREVTHLSRGWSGEAARQLGEDLRAQVTGLR